jgi:hypothetical protein
MEHAVGDLMRSLGSITRLIIGLVVGRQTVMRRAPAHRRKSARMGPATVPVSAETDDSLKKYRRQLAQLADEQIIAD